MTWCLRRSWGQTLDGTLPHWVRHSVWITSQCVSGKDNNLEFLWRLLCGLWKKEFILAYDSKAHPKVSKRQAAGVAEYVWAVTASWNMKQRAQTGVRWGCDLGKPLPTGLPSAARLHLLNLPKLAAPSRTNSQTPGHSRVFLIQITTSVNSKKWTSLCTFIYSWQSITLQNPQCGYQIIQGHFLSLIRN